MGSRDSYGEDLARLAGLLARKVIYKEYKDRSGVLITVTLCPFSRKKHQGIDEGISKQYA